jgi:ribonuclease Z
MLDQFDEGTQSLHHNQAQTQPHCTPGGYYIAGAWTKAGIGSCVQIKGRNKENLLFDCGVTEDQTYNADHVFISHGHVDHIGAVVMHARGRFRDTPCKYYVPAKAVEPLTAAFVAFAELDDKDIPAEIIAVSPGDVINVSPTCCVKAFQTVHRVPSQGYALFSRSKGGLLPEYRHKRGAEIRALKQQGHTIVGPPVETLEVVYTGDTTFEGLLRNNFVFSAPMLIMELTYLDGDSTAAVKYTHVHISDIVNNWEMFQNQFVVFVHISPRYNPASRVIAILRSELPVELQSKVLVNLKSFGERNAVNKILRDVSLEGCNRQVGWAWGTQKRVYPNARDSNNLTSRSGAGDSSNGRSTMTDHNYSSYRRGNNNSSTNSTSSSFAAPMSWSKSSGDSHIFEAVDAANVGGSSSRPMRSGYGRGVGNILFRRSASDEHPIHRRFTNHNVVSRRTVSAHVAVMGIGDSAVVERSPKKPKKKHPHTGS